MTTDSYRCISDGHDTEGFYRTGGTHHRDGRSPWKLVNMAKPIYRLLLPSQDKTMPATRAKRMERVDHLCSTQEFDLYSSLPNTRVQKTPLPGTTRAQDQILVTRLPGPRLHIVASAGWKQTAGVFLRFHSSGIWIALRSLRFK